MGMFDDLIPAPAASQARGGMFDDLIPTNPAVAAAPAAAIAPAAPAIPSPPAAQPGGVNYTPGVQGLTRGLTADVAGMPVDLASLLTNAVMSTVEKGGNLVNKGINSVIGGPTSFTPENVQLPRVTSPVGGSNMIADAASAAGDAVGFHTRDPAAMTTGEQLRYGTGRGAGAAIGTVGAAGGLRMAAEAPAVVEAAANSPIAASLRDTILKRTEGIMQPYTEVATGAPMQTAAAEAARQAAPLVTDAAAGASAGAAATLAQQKIPDSWGIGKDIATFVAGMGGGVAGAKGVAPVKGLITTADRAVERRVTDPVSGENKYNTKLAARAQQEVAIDPAAAAQNIDEAARFYAKNNVPAQAQPTAAAMSGDPGLIGGENIRRVQQPSAFIQRDRALQADAKQRVEETALPAIDYTQPKEVTDAQIAAGTHADPRAPQATAQQQIADQTATHAAEIADLKTQIAELQQTNAAKLQEAEQARAASETIGQQRVAQTTEQLTAAQQAEKDLAAAATPTVSADDASRALHTEVVDKGLKPLQAERSAAYEAGKTAGQEVPLDPAKVTAALKGVKDASNKELGPLTDPKDLPKEFADLERQVEEAAGRPATATDPGAPPKPVTLGNLMALRPAISAAADAAQAAGNVRHANILRDTQKTLSGLIDEASAGVEGETGAALRAGPEFDKTKFGPVYGRGPGSEAEKLRRDVNKDRPGGTTAPPSETAPRFLAAKSSPEVAADMRRMIDSAQDPKAGLQAARDYIASDLGSVLKNGKVDVKTLDNWAKSRAGVLEQFPEVAAEVKQLRLDAVNKSKTSGELQEALNSHSAAAKAADREHQLKIKEIEGNAGLSEKAKTAQLTDLDRNWSQQQREIDSSALGQAAGKSPENFVKGIFSAADPVKSLKEAADTFKGNEAARNGLKRAVSDHLYDKMTADAGPGNMTSAKVNKTLGAYDEALRKSGLYSGEELNALQVARKQINDRANLDQRASTGSDTAEKLGLGRDSKGLPDIPTGVKLLLRMRYGQIKGGGVTNHIKLVLQSFKEHGLDFSKKSGQDQANAILDRATVDPQLASHLLKMPAQISEMSNWNTQLTQLISAQAVAQNEDD